MRTMESETPAPSRYTVPVRAGTRLPASKEETGSATDGSSAKPDSKFGGQVPVV